MPAKKTPISKSDFIRSQPSTLSAGEVLAKAKAAGLKLTSQLVYKVRGTAKAKGKAKRSSGTTNARAVGTVPSKAAFVRGLPASTPAKEVVKQAKAAGIKIGISYVYNIRGAAKSKRAPAKSPAVGAVTSGASWSIAAHAENLLRAVAAEIGLGSAIEILRGERERVHAALHT